MMMKSPLQQLVLLFTFLLSLAPATAAADDYNNNHRELQLFNGSITDVISGGGGGNDGGGSALENWLSGIVGGATSGDGVDTCSILKNAIGLGQAFGMAGQCDCTGSIMTEMEISCSFEQCVPTSIIGSGTSGNDGNVCGTTVLNMTFGGGQGVTTGVCTDFPGDKYRETCFSYEISFGGADGGPGVTTSCQASYGGQDCACSIESFCLKLDCSADLPGATMDTCQFLSMQLGNDTSSWFPQFDFLNPNFTLDAGAIPWQNISWDNMDWNNFDFSSVQWNSPEWLSKSWTDLVGSLGGGAQSAVPSGICTLMSKAVQMTEQLGKEGSCVCDTSNGLQMICNFMDLCTDTDLCGNVNMTLHFGSLAGVDNEVCIKYSGDARPDTCFSYRIPIADRSASPECGARYGDAGECTCTIDENFCISVDCTEFEPTALTDTCQVVNLDGATEAQRLMLEFKAPEENVASDGSKANNAQAGNGSAGSTAQRSVAGVISLVSAAVLHNL